jgi:hypothetical protein
MANTQVAGFQPVRVIGGGNVSYKRGRVLTNNTTAIFLYDALKTTSSGDYLVASATNTAIASVSGGASYVNTKGQRVQDKYLPATTLYTSSGIDPDNASYVFVVEDELRVEFRASVDEAIALTDLGINYLQVLGTGSTTTGLSGHELDATSRNTTSTLPWRVKEFVLGGSESDPDAADAHVICSVNRSLTTAALSDGTGT